MQRARLVFTFVSVLLVGLSSFACESRSGPPPPSSERFAECSGVVAFRGGEDKREHAAVRVFDDRGEVWYAAEFNRTGFEAVRDNGPNPIAPLAFIRGGYTPEFRCTGLSPTWFRVIAGESYSEPEIKYILRRDSLFEMKSWHQYYTSSSVIFDAKKNPIRSRDGGTGEVIPYPAATTPFRVADVKGEWLNVEWKEGKSEYKSGWIRWRDEKADRVVVQGPYPQ